MKDKIETSIIIETSIDKVWEVLMDFDSYSQWNPFILSINGKQEIGEKLEVKFDKMTFKPTILRLDKNRTLEWKGKLLFGGLFDGIHLFELRKISEQKVELIQKESFSGLLIPFMKKMIRIETKGNFIKMNEALKQRCESNVSTN